MDAQSPHAAAEIGHVPACREFCIIAAAGTIGVAWRRARIEGHRRQGLRRRALHIEKVLPALDAMVIMAGVDAIRGIESMDHAGLQIGDKKLPVPTVVSNITKARA